MSANRAVVMDRWTNKDGKRTDRYGIGMRWRARFVDDRGKEQTKAFARKVDARAWLDDVITRLGTGTYTNPQAGRATVATVYQSWASVHAHISVRTAATRKTTWGVRVEPEWGDVPVVEVQTSAIRAWVQSMVDDGAACRASQARSPCCVRSLGPRSRTAGYLETRAMASNCRSGNTPIAVTWPTSRCRRWARTATRNPKVVRFLAYTGPRSGEMAALRVQDFDMLRRRVNVYRSVTECNGLTWSTPKTHERRSVPCPKALADELSALMVDKDCDALVFIDQRGRVIRNTNWRKRVFAHAVAKCQKADDSFPTITPHDLRHTAASLAVSAGANVKAVQRMLGHAKPSMTLDICADLFDHYLDAVAANLDHAICAAELAKSIQT